MTTQKKIWGKRLEFGLLLLTVVGFGQGGLMELADLVTRPLDVKADTLTVNRLQRKFSEHEKLTADIVHKHELRELKSALDFSIASNAAVIDDMHTNQDKFLETISNISLTITSMNSQLGIILKDQGYSPGR